mmetsp:Transcript_42019/g.134139  ORF Transcript_42019/g.134139 Transcript_42019/m.134139 type:complete len:205 (-) Transcript_42019:1056-1670(-)
MPVSWIFTATPIPPFDSSVNSVDRRMWPLWVNLEALPMRLLTICAILPSSPTTHTATAGAMSSHFTVFLISGFWRSTTLCSTAPRFTGSRLITSALSLKLAASRMSFTRLARRAALERITPRVLRVPTPKLLTLSWRSDSVSPMIPFRGVRSSCETAAKNFSCMSLAVLSSSSTILRAVMSLSVTRIDCLPVPGSRVGIASTLK